MAEHLFIDGSDFRDAIIELGEIVTFQTEPKITQYASIAPHRTTNTTDGSYWYHGVMTFEDVDQQNELIGEYFKRQTNAVPVYILTSTMSENTTPNMAEVYAVECNDKIDIISHYETSSIPNEFGEYSKEPVYIAKNVACYITVTQKPLSDQIAGTFVSTTTNLTLPAKYMLTQDNIVVKKGFVYDDTLKKNIYTDIKYQIESVDSSMMDALSKTIDVDGVETTETKFVGILRCTMTEDKR